MFPNTISQNKTPDPDSIVLTRKKKKTIVN